jgi:hypothetical protein
MTKYERSLVARLKDADQWPRFEDVHFLDRLDVVAERALRKRSIEGNLAAVLIYHQLVEEMLRLLVHDSQFLVQVALRPRPIEFSKPSKRMFGLLQEDLRRSLGFRQRDQLLALAEEINALRIEVVHKLTRRRSFAGLARDGRRAKRLYERIFRIFEDVHDDFRLGLNDFRKEL